MRRNKMVLVAAGMVVWMQAQTLLTALQPTPRAALAIEILIVLFQCAALVWAMRVSQRAYRWIALPVTLVQGFLFAAPTAWQVATHPKVDYPSTSPDALPFDFLIAMVVCGLLLWLLSDLKPPKPLAHRPSTD